VFVPVSDQKHRGGLLDFQRESLDRFLQPSAPGARRDEGLQRALSVFPVASSDGAVSLSCSGYALEEPKRSAADCARGGLASFSSPLRLAFLLASRGPDGQVSRQSECEVYLGELPRLTERGTLLIEGQERVLPARVQAAAGLWLARTRAGTPTLLAIDELGSRLSLERLSGGLSARLELGEGVAASALVAARAHEHTLRVTEQGLRLFDSSAKGRGKSVGEPLSGRRLRQLKLAHDVLAEGAKRPLAPRGKPLTEALVRKMIERGVREIVATSFDEAQLPSAAVGLGAAQVGDWLAAHLGSFSVPAGPAGRLDPRLEGRVGPPDERGALVIDAAALAALAAALLSSSSDELAPPPTMLLAAGDLLARASRVALAALAEEARRRMSELAAPHEQFPFDIINTRLFTQAIHRCIGVAPGCLAEPWQGQNPLRGLEHARAVRLEAGLPPHSLLRPCDALSSARPGRLAVLPLLAAVDERGDASLPAAQASQARQGRATLAEALSPAAGADPEVASQGATSMLRALPLVEPEAPRLPAPAGLEREVARESGAARASRCAGTVTHVDPYAVVVLPETGGPPEIHELRQPDASLEGTLLGQRPCVSVGQHVEAGAPLADGEATAGGGLALGRNARAAFSGAGGARVSARAAAWFTSAHARWLECSASDTRHGTETLSYDLPGEGEPARRNLDRWGVIKLGAEVGPGDVLVGKLTPGGDGRGAQDTSLRVPPGLFASVARLELLVRDRYPTETSLGERAAAARAATLARLEHLPHLHAAAQQAHELQEALPAGVLGLIRVLLVERRTLAVGDTLADRHGLTARVEAIVPDDQMPLLPDGNHADVVLPWPGEPTLAEAHLGLVAARDGDERAQALLASGDWARTVAEAKRAAEGVVYLMKLG
jgi:DNA-directed RNA polymerase beta subunit